MRFSLIPVFQFLSVFLSLSLSVRAASVSETLKLRKQIMTEHVGLSILTSVSISFRQYKQWVCSRIVWNFFCLKIGTRV